jgi:hypothetical protein
MAQMAGLLGGAATEGGMTSAIAGGAASGMASGGKGGQGQSKKGGLFNEVPEGQDIMQNFSRLGNQTNHVVNLLSNSGTAGNMPALPPLGNQRQDQQGTDLTSQLLAKLGAREDADSAALAKSKSTLGQ